MLRACDLIYATLTSLLMVTMLYFLYLRDTIVAHLQNGERLDVEISSFHFHKSSVFFHCFQSKIHSHYLTHSFSQPGFNPPFQLYFPFLFNNHRTSQKKISTTSSSTTFLPTPLLILYFGFGGKASHSLYLFL